MNDTERREEGRGIGHGMVGSSIQPFEARLADPGMGWGHIGAERLLPVRAAVMSHRFDPLWPVLCTRP
ncbi:MAG: hypothetical protein ACK4OK_04315 [Thermoflexus sp.]